MRSAVWGANPSDEQVDEAVVAGVHDLWEAEPAGVPDESNNRATTSTSTSCAAMLVTCLPASEQIREDSALQRVVVALETNISSNSMLSNPGIRSSASRAYRIPKAS